MTREEADILQDTLDEYVQLSNEVPEPEPDAPQGKFRTIKLPSGEKKTVKVPSKRAAVNMMRMNLGMFFAHRIPDIEVGGFDMSMILGPLVSLFGKKDPKKSMPAVMAVVDGHENADENAPDFDEKYCVTIPGDVWREALNMKSTMKVGQMAMDKESEDGKA